jgi:hypothetical protein
VTLVHPCLEVIVDCNSDGCVIPGEDAQFIVTLNNCGDVDLSVDVATSWGICEGIGIEIPAGGTEICYDSVPVPLDWVDPNICLEVIANWDILDDRGGCLPNEDTVFAEGCCCVQPPGGEGCTPGFWKNNAQKWGASAWCDLFDPSDSFEGVFGVDVTLRGKGKNTIASPTLLEALNANGGGINALARHATAALLNACSDCVQYDIASPAAVIAAVQAAIAAGDEAIQALHEELAYYNEAGCPANQHGECVGVEEEIMLP